MGKPLVHLIPSHHAKLRDDASVEGKEPPAALLVSKRNNHHKSSFLKEVKRSSTHSSHTTSKSSSSGESSSSSSCSNSHSFVHSNASVSTRSSSSASSSSSSLTLTSSRSIGRNYDCPKHKHGTTMSRTELAMVKPNNTSTATLSTTTTTTSAAQKSKDGRVRIAAMDGLEESIEITRQKSLKAAQKRKFLWLGSSTKKKPPVFPTKRTAELKQQPVASAARVPPRAERTPSRQRRVRQASSSITTTTTTGASSSFFSAMDVYVDEKKTVARNRRAKQLTLVGDSIEVVVQSKSKSKTVAVLFPDERAAAAATKQQEQQHEEVLSSPSEIHKVRRTPTIILPEDRNRCFEENHHHKAGKESSEQTMTKTTPPMFVQQQQQVEEGQEEAIEVGESGSVVSPAEKQKPPYRRLVQQQQQQQQTQEDRTAIEVGLRTKTPVSPPQQQLHTTAKKISTSRLRIFQQLLGKKKKSPPNIRVISSEEDQTIELLRSRSSTLRRNREPRKTSKSSSTISYEEEEEDAILKTVATTSSSEEALLPGPLELEMEDNTALQVLEPSSLSNNNNNNDAEDVVEAMEMVVGMDDRATTMPITNTTTNVVAAPILVEEEQITIEVEAAPALVNNPLFLESSLSFRVGKDSAQISSNSVEKEESSSSSSSSSTKEENIVVPVSPAGTTREKKLVEDSNTADADRSRREVNDAATEPTAAVVVEEKDHDVFFQREAPAPNVNQNKKNQTTILVPKIPAPKNDTTPKIIAAAALGPNDAAAVAVVSSLKDCQKRPPVNILQVENNNIKNNNIEVMSPSIDETQQQQQQQQREKESVVAKTSGILSTGLKNKKYAAMVVKPPKQPTIASNNNNNSATGGAASVVPNCKHIVHVNVLGVAGIVVDRKRCIDATGLQSSPPPPEKMAVVVGLSEPGRRQSMDKVTTFSSPLTHAPSARTKDKKTSERAEASSSSPLLQRHIAVWASDQRGETPGSIVESNVLETQVSDPSDPKSKYRSKFLDLNVAIAKNAAQDGGNNNNHVAVVIGEARIEINDKMIRRGENRTIDVPVRRIRIADVDDDDEASNNSVIKLGSVSERKSGISKLFVKKSSREDSSTRQKSVLSAYTIDPQGDSMIRLQVRVEEVHTFVDQEKVSRLGSFANRTAATVETDDSSFAKSILRSSSTTCRAAFDEFCPIKPNNNEVTVSAKPITSTTLEEDLYSTPVEEQPTDVAKDVPVLPTVSWKGKLLESKNNDKLSDSNCGCGVLPSFTSRKEVERQIDDKIDLVEHVFANHCASRRENEEDESLVGMETITTIGKNTEWTGTTTITTTDDYDDKDTAATRETFIVGMKSMLQPVPMLGPVPSMEDIRGLAKELALTSGEYFFPEDPQIVENDNASVGSATLVAFETGQLRMRSMESRDSWKKDGVDDDNRTRSTLGSYGSKQSFVQDEVVAENKFDIDTAKDKTADNIDENKRRDSYNNISRPREDKGCNVDDDDDDDDEDEEMSAVKDRPSLVDIEEENSLRKQQQQQDGTKADDKPSLPSVVENIAEVLSIGGKACGYFAAEDNVGSPTGIWTTKPKQHQDIPDTIDPPSDDAESVGELTAITLEKDEIRDRNRKLLMSRLGLPSDIFSRGSSKGSGSEPGDRETPHLVLGNNSSVINQPNAMENYFAEYDEQGKANGVCSIYSTSATSMQRARSGTTTSYLRTDGTSNRVQTVVENGNNAQSSALERSQGVDDDEESA